MKRAIKQEASPAVPIEASVMTVEMWDINRPKDYPKNARKWTPSDIEQVALSIRKFGFRQPIVVDKDGVIIVGHLRRAGARMCGLKQVPVHVASDLSPEAVKAYRLADNRTGELADWMPEFLGPEFLDLKIADFDLASTGFDIGDIMSMVFSDVDFKSGTKKIKGSRNAEAGADESGKLIEKFQVLVECESEAKQIEALGLLTAGGFACQAVAPS